MLCKRCVQSNCVRLVGHSECNLISTRTQSLHEFRRPFFPMTQCIDLLAGTRNSPAPVDRFYACHYSSKIPRDRQVRACQFSQGAKTVLAVPRPISLLLGTTAVPVRVRPRDHCGSGAFLNRSCACRKPPLVWPTASTDRAARQPTCPLRKSRANCRVCPTETAESSPFIQANILGIIHEGAPCCRR